ncbi:MAG: GTP-binding protein, partial [Hyphomicrobiaceae bacterium]
LSAAAVVIVTKTDIAGADDLENVRTRLPGLAPHARVLTSANGALAAGDLLAALEGGISDRHHGEPHHHHHDDHTHTDELLQRGVHAGGVTSAFLPVPKPVSWPALISALDTLTQAHAAALLRLKGIVRLEGAPGYHSVQATPGQGISRQEIPVEENEEPPRLGFTVIAAYEPAAGLCSSLGALIAIRTARSPGASEGA